MVSSNNLKLAALFIIALSYMLFGCIGNGDEAAKGEVSPPIPGKTIVSKNIIVLVDLSNRITRQGDVDDPAIVREILKAASGHFKKSIDNNTSDKLQIRSVNTAVYGGALTEDEMILDLHQYKDNVKDKSDYVFCRNQCIDNDIDSVANKFEGLYLKQKGSKQKGADIWDYFQKEMVAPLLCNDVAEVNFRDISMTSTCQNYIILLTDGYIETTESAKTLPVDNNPNIRITLTGQQISSFRNEFNRSGADKSDLEGFFNAKQYGVKPVANKYLEEAKILVIDLEDRYSDEVVNFYPTDMDIIKLFWSDWLEKSGFKPENIKLEHRRSSLGDIRQIIENFLR